MEEKGNTEAPLYTPVAWRGAGGEVMFFIPLPLRIIEVAAFALPVFMRNVLISLTICTVITACSQSRRIAQKAPQPPNDTAAIASLIGAAQQVFINDTALAGAHVGISIYDPAASRYLYNYQGDKYFVPASNTKLFTCYAAMKYLGDSLVGLRYEKPYAGYTPIEGTGDPTFLHPDFKNQPVMDFLKQTDGLALPLTDYGFRATPYGKGWPWDDYNDDYAVERSVMPIYGNVVRFYLQSDTVVVNPSVFFNPGFSSENLLLSKKGVEPWFKITRNQEYNFFHPVYTNEVYRSKTKFSGQEIPFKTISSTEPPASTQIRTYVKLLADTIHKKVGDYDYVDGKYTLKNVIHSQPTDSLLKPMMHRSDNFFAEQSLLMVSNEKLGYMDDEAIIDTLLKTDLKDLPQKPVWVDGSGLSRYNMFTPQDMVAVLLKMKNEFGLERIRNILPKGNTGTLTNYYQQIGPAIFAKTGSLSGQVALSGFLTCKSGKLFIFSVMINNYTNSGRAVRRGIEKFVMQVWEKN